MLFKFHKPFVVGCPTFRGADLWGYGIFDHFSARTVAGLEDGLVHFFSDDMFAEGRDIVFDPSGDADAERVEGNEFDGIADVVAPQSGIAVDDQGVIFAGFDLPQGIAEWVFGKNFVGGHKFEEDTGSRIEEQAGLVLCILEGEEPFGSGEGFHAVYAFAYELF